MYKLYCTNGSGTTISIRRGLFRTLWTALKLKLSGYRTTIVRY